MPRLRPAPGSAHSEGTLWVPALPANRQYTLSPFIVEYLTNRCPSVEPVYRHLRPKAGKLLREFVLQLPLPLRTAPWSSLKQPEGSNPAEDQKHSHRELTTKLEVSGE